jgi:anti-sigma regulatory factor (Ser/Thr protein kinase)
MIDGGQYIQDYLRMAPDDQFYGRKEELHSILETLTALPRLPVPSSVLVGPGRSGTSELLKRVYKELFLTRKTVVPFYYRFDRPFHEPVHFVRDYLANLICQYLAFKEQDPSLLPATPAYFSYAQKLVHERSEPVLDRMLDDVENAFASKDREGAVQIALHAPLLLADEVDGFGCMMLDHFHLALRMTWADCTPLADLFPLVMESRRVPYLLTGPAGVLQRDFLDRETTAGKIHRIPIEVLDEESALEAFLAIATSYGVQTDMEAVRNELRCLYGIPFYMVCLIRRARQEEVSLTSEENLRDLYFREVSGGEIADYFEALLNRCFSDPFAKRDAVRLMNLSPLTGGSILRIEEVSKRVSLDLQRVQEITETLIQAGLLEGNYAMVHCIPDPVLADFLKVAQRSWLTRTDRESIRREILKEAPDVPILTELQKSEEKGEKKKRSDKISFGLVLPMVSETELVAARALEQVAERADFPDEDIGKIRMALIEACINSFEHSGSRDGKIYITFTLDKEKLTIVVEDKGRSFEAGRVPVPERGTGAAKPSRRGWGIELIKNLMDQVDFDDVAVGTRLKMIKYYPRETDVKAEAG